MFHMSSVLSYVMCCIYPVTCKNRKKHRNKENSKNIFSTNAASLEAKQKSFKVKLKGLIVEYLLSEKPPLLKRTKLYWKISKFSTNIWKNFAETLQFEDLMVKNHVHIFCEKNLKLV